MHSDLIFRSKVAIKTICTSPVLKHAIPFLFLLLTVVKPDASALQVPSETQLLHFYRQKLDAPFYGNRMDGITGLAHLGPAAAPAASDLIDIAESDSESPFYRLLACWAMAGIRTPETRRYVRNRVASVEREQPARNIHMVAAEAALLAATGVSRLTIDRYLPELYNQARSGDPSEKLLAAWALFEIGTAVTRETTDRALSEFRVLLDPTNGNFTRHLRYLRLLERPSAAGIVPRLEELVSDDSFDNSLVRKKSQTALTLATVTYPAWPEAMAGYLERIEQSLGNIFERSSALHDILNLGPFACTGSIERRLEKIGQEAPDEEDRKRAADALRFCRE